MVHISHYKKAEEALAQKKLKAVEGKKVITTGPWQIIDIPTKVKQTKVFFGVTMNMILIITILISRYPTEGATT